MPSVANRDKFATNLTANRILTISG
ncbi:hypothetical protein MESS2_1280006 [Mesorhizobium metallidurans STM 2683]|uniref:Uncharacterized protein n=1 Tax=Mesorhizobium metallidurans STM 2683 TaxID=1297569 RepID=M5EK08_9HYPH|nr:hypothetical protein MESS2_1280006 [Mesorhizobium metallidurans STM 2683]